MDGLHFGLGNKCIEKVTQNAGNLSLLAKGGETEVMLENIKSQEFFCIEPLENSEIMEFFYILKGSILFQENEKNTILEGGDYFYVHNIKETAHFYVVDEVTLIYVCSKPIFQYLSDRMRKVTEMITLVENKDIYTFNHGKRVKDYCMKIGKRLGFSKERLEVLGFASLCHDVGKINVPDEILNKPGRLTDEEMDYIKKHPQDGADIVEKGFLHPTYKIIQQHHERLDGSGYPLGLKDKDILLEAKIIAVADTYDAMTTDRAYRKGMDTMVAVNELRRLKGIHYDKEVVDTFEQVLKEEGMIE
ncbi:HD domain-containing protein [Clostridium bovifaecis]|uniref:HD domain-containing protein n=1 Tax=Clostridium bovifaecis TaxID=2184719 RepID=A0A6I6EX59_9CLOT|nr:HD domain-containing protein [Clostridium bovifaecis]